MFRRSKRRTSPDLRIYYASDVHGSDVCWRKFLNAARFYDAQVLIMGGDLVGKAIVPIEMRSTGTAVSRFHDREVSLEGDSAIEEFEREVRTAGLYPYRASREELDHLDADADARRALWDRVVANELERWFAVAAAKLDERVEVFVMPGNDDPWFVDELIEQSGAVVACDRRVVEFHGIQMISLGIANPTPWDSIRELGEDELYAEIERMAVELSEGGPAIFNLHVPPHDSGLDTAPLLDGSLRPITRMGQVEEGPVGSVAVRRAILEYEPSLSLHGHIHEARAVAQLGRTVAINPGSDYGSGHIHGALIDMAGGQVLSHQLVSG